MTPTDPPFSRSTRVAYFSPLPPKRTGIATYSAQLIPELARHLTLTLHDTAPTDSRLAGLPVHDPVAHPAVLMRGDFDVRLYHLGNNPHFHLEIYHALLRQPGVVVLHDAVLYFLVAGQGAGGLLKELCLEHGVRGLAEYQRILQSCPRGELLAYPHPGLHALLGRVLRHALGIIVHSETSRRQIRALGYSGPMETVPMLHHPASVAQAMRHDASRTRAELGVAPGEVLLGSFGFIGSTKRIPVVLRALSRLLHMHIPFRFLVVGVGNDLEPEIRALGLSRYVIQTGFVEEVDFNRYLAVTDIVINLRYPSMGETSATVIQAMAHGKPCIVTDHAWHSELPDETVCKLRWDDREEDQLVEQLKVLAGDPAHRLSIGARARKYVLSKHDPKSVAKHYADFLDTKGIGASGWPSIADRFGGSACLS